MSFTNACSPLVVPTRVNQAALVIHGHKQCCSGEGMFYSFKCVCRSDVSCSWPMLLGGDGDKEREHRTEHPTRMRGGPLGKGGMFVCAIPTDILPRGVLLICVMFCLLSLLCSHLLFSPPLSLLSPSLPLSSLLSPLPLLFFFPLFHFLFAPTQLDSLAMMFCAVLICGPFAQNI